MPYQALQQTAGHDSFLGLQAHRCPAAAERLRSALKDEVAVIPEVTNPTADLVTLAGFSKLIRFDGVDWVTIPAEPGVYVVFDRGECLYVGMAGRDGSGTLRKILTDHSTGQVVNMFAQYRFLARVQFLSEGRITHPRAAKVACRAYILERCSFNSIEFNSVPSLKA
jgi:hypothetical protein